MRLWSVMGNAQRLDGGAMFGNAPRALWSRWMAPDDNNQVALACRCLLVEGINGQRVLFETGVGAFFEPRLRERYGVVEDRHVLLDSLADLGLTDADIDVVVLSHLHFDHAGGLLTAWRDGAEPRLLFPNASFVVGKEAWQRAQQPHPRDRASFIPAMTELLSASGRLEIVDGERCRVLGDAVRFTVSNGHTPGMLLAEIGGDGGVVFCADLIPGTAWVHLPITMGYDRYPEKLIDEKESFLEDKRSRNVRLFFTHDPEIACAGVRRDERGRYVPVDPVEALRGEELRGARSQEC